MDVVSYKAATVGRSFLNILYTLQLDISGDAGVAIRRVLKFLGL